MSYRTPPNYNDDDEEESGLFGLGTTSKTGAMGSNQERRGAERGEVGEVGEVAGGAFTRPRAPNHPKPVVRPKTDGLKALDALLYIRSVVETRVALYPDQIASDTKATITSMIATSLEGRCNADGYIQPGSVELLNHSTGRALHRGTIEYTAIVAYNACNPATGTVLHRACTCVSITKVGIYATITDSRGNVPANVFIYQELSADNPTYADIKVGDKFSVRVMYVRTELNDKHITIGGTIVSLGDAGLSTVEAERAHSLDAVLLRRVMDLETMKSDFVNGPSGVERAAKHKDFLAVYTLDSDRASYITRVIQEIPILSTKMTVTVRGKPQLLPSFIDVWNDSRAFRDAIESAPDVFEAKWELAKQYNYRMVTTFMPPYAVQIYKHFKAKRILDPCGGWGDRLLGAVALGKNTGRFDASVHPSDDQLVEKYVCFDPNPDVRAGYAEILRLFAIQPVEAATTGNYMRFENGFEVHTQPFEVGAAQLTNESFDLVFTSPPFFDLEVYNAANPTYDTNADWLVFYRQLFLQAERCVVRGGHVAIHIDNTSAGKIEPFMESVETFTGLVFLGRIGLTGVMSSVVRSVWVFRRPLPNERA